MPIPRERRGERGPQTQNKPVREASRSGTPTQQIHSSTAPTHPSSAWDTTEWLPPIPGRCSTPVLLRGTGGNGSRERGCLFGLQVVFPVFPCFPRGAVLCVVYPLSSLLRHFRTRCEENENEGVNSRRRSASVEGLSRSSPCTLTQRTTSGAPHAAMARISSPPKAPKPARRRRHLTYAQRVLAAVYPLSQRLRKNRISPSTLKKHSKSSPGQREDHALTSCHLRSRRSLSVGRRLQAEQQAHHECSTHPRRQRDPRLGPVRDGASGGGEEGDQQGACSPREST